MSFGRYRLLEELGAGGMARVYRADMKGPSGFTKPVAVKRIHPHLVARNPRFTKLFISEARLGGYLNHPNVLQTLDFGEIDGVFFIAMELVDGPTLLQLLSQCRRNKTLIPPEIALEIIRQATAGVGAAHIAIDSDGSPLKMIHRDLKPSNILLTSQGHVKVADFGVARAETNLLKTAMTGALRGTVNYMSPEQAWGKRDIDQRADLFSLNVLLFELLTLRRLYPGTNPGQVLRLAQDGDFGDIAAHIPPMPGRSAVIKLLKKGLAKDPNGRFKDAISMEQALYTVSADMPRTRLGAWLKERQEPRNKDDEVEIFTDMGDELTLDPTSKGKEAQAPSPAPSPADDMPTVLEVSAFKAPLDEPPLQPDALGALKKVPLHLEPTQGRGQEEALPIPPMPPPKAAPKATPEEDDDPWADMATAIVPEAQRSSQGRDPDQTIPIMGRSSSPSFQSKPPQTKPPQPWPAQSKVPSSQATIPSGAPQRPSPRPPAINPTPKKPQVDESLRTVIRPHVPSPAPALTKAPSPLDTVPGALPPIQTLSPELPPLPQNDEVELPMDSAPPRKPLPLRTKIMLGVIAGILILALSSFC